MNGITRVLVSVALLGACAGAMRLTMYSIEAKEATYQHHFARVETGDVEEVKLFAMMNYNLRSVIIGTGRNGIVAGSYAATQADSITIDGQAQDGVFEANYDLWAFNHSGFLFNNRPSPLNDANLRLPPNVPLNVEVSMNSEAQTRVQIDLRSLHIRKFLFASDKAPKSVSLYVPKANDDSSIVISNYFGSNSIYITEPNEGKLNVASPNAATILYLKKEIPVRLRIRIKAASSADALRRITKWSGLEEIQFESVDFSASGIKEVANIHWFVYNPKNTTKELSVVIDLGQTGSLTLAKMWETK